MNKLISGCMITKNEGYFLRQSIGSFIDYVDELIIIDDNSTDDTLDIINSFPQDKITLVQGTYNGDKATQRNEYLKRATGQWIFCPDGDEVYQANNLLWLLDRINVYERMWTVRVGFYHFWKDYVQIIQGHVWGQYLQRMFKNIPGLKYDEHHHSVSLSDGRNLAKESSAQGRHLQHSPFMVFHYSYCKPADQIREKIKYYMRRDNTNCVTEEDVEKYTEMHPYFSGIFNYPRYGTGGLSCCGAAGNLVDRVIPYDGSHPEIMKTHPDWPLYHESAITMNNYMTQHWQYHNHLHYLHHQKRMELTAKYCTGKTLEVGCADGSSVFYLQSLNPNIQIDGCEPTGWGFLVARKKHPDFKFFNDYAENLSMKDGSYDTVILPEMIEHVLDIKPVLDNAFRVARKRVIITTPAKHHDDPDHKRIITPDIMRKILKPYASSVTITGLTFQGWRGPVALAKTESEIHFMVMVANK